MAAAARHGIRGSAGGAGFLVLLAYNLALAAAVLLAAPAVLFLFFAREKRKKTLLARLGFQDYSKLPAFGPRPVWIHALSVGEVNAAAPLVRALLEQGGRPVVATASTLTGRRRAGELFPGVPVLYFPFDLPFSVKRVVDAINPAAFVLVETDLWPNLLLTLKRRGVPAVLANGRLSDSSFAGYRRARRLLAPALSAFFAVGAATEEDARRYAALGVPEERISVTGNLKFDAPEPEPLTVPGLDPKTPLVVAGSTHPGEEDLLASALSGLKARLGAALVVAPRDPDRAGAVARLFKARGFSVSLFSGLDGGAFPDVAVVDKMGLLARLYSAGRVCFVGGSLAPEGGHNPLEPAAAGRPVVFGPHMEDFSEIADTLLSRGAALSTDAPALEKVLERLLADPAEADRMGRAGLAAVRENRGSVQRTLDLLTRAEGEAP
ncbi:MAG: 3-deoxy-D-manno-octulosonic acid transferase [Deltaproteobacteria bacterium]|nr:3-deoxy-D-manno-octulosonic acid transferase [Deltaproteobacteria bacterium]